MKFLFKLVVFFIAVGTALYLTGFTPEKALAWIDSLAGNPTVAAGVDAISDLLGLESSSVREERPVSSVSRAGSADEDGSEIEDEIIRSVLDIQETITLNVKLPFSDIKSKEASEYILSQVERAVAIIRQEHPSVFWMSLGSYNVQWEGLALGSEVTLTLEMNYCLSRSEAIQLRRQINSVTRAIAADAPADPYDAVRYFHDWIIDNSVYAPEVAGLTNVEGYESAFNIDGIFLDGSAVCEGYTKAFKMLCDMAEIPCRIVFGVANGENHSWNYVNLDGDWYLVDCTWDNPIIEGGGKVKQWEYFLRGSESVVGDEIISQIYRNDSSEYPVLSPDDFPGWGTASRR